MSRPTKFRAWDVDARRMVADFDIEASTGTPVRNTAMTDPRTLILLEFTGLLDKNGNEIFEGDILRWKESGTAVVEYHAPSFKANVHNYRDLDPFLTELDFFNREVIGNVYENPEFNQTESAWEIL